MSEYSRDTKWGTHLGNWVTVRGMSDEHLANSIQFMTKYPGHYASDILPTLKEEAKLRELSDEFLDRAPFPYKDGQGNYIVWDYQLNKPKAIGRYDRG